MPEQTYTPLFSEVLDKVSKAKTKDKKIEILRKHKTDSLKMLLKAAFDPKIVWCFPEGNVPLHLMIHQKVQIILSLHKRQRNSGTLLKVQTIAPNNIKKKICSFRC